MNCVRLPPVGEPADAGSDPILGPVAAPMQRIAGLAARRDLRGLAAGAQAWSSGSICSRDPAFRCQQRGRWCSGPGRPLSTEPGQRCSRRRFVFAGGKCRLFSSRAGAEEPPGSPGSQPHISVVGIPDPLTWIRCRVITLLIELYFEVDINSAEFHRGVKQVNYKKYIKKNNLKFNCNKLHKSHTKVDVKLHKCVYVKNNNTEKFNSLHSNDNLFLNIHQLIWQS